MPFVMVEGHLFIQVNRLENLGGGLWKEGLFKKHCSPVKQGEKGKTENII